MTRAAIYLRISQDPTGEQAGVTRQREDCLALVEQAGWEVHEVYQDNDISASSGAKRPEYERMLKEIKAGHVDALVAWHPDRLYRKARTLEDLLDAVEKQNVIMRTVRAGEVDLSTPTGRMLARMVAVMAQGEGEVKADRWMRSWRQGREAGKPAKTGTRLFGYTRDGEVIDAAYVEKHRDCDPEECNGQHGTIDEAEVARRMAKDIASGVSISKVTLDLQRDGILTTRGNTWRTGTVRQYLSQPRIAGYSTLKGEIVAEGTWEPIIDRDTWETVRALFTGRARERPPRVALLGGLIYCGECGTRLITGSIGATRAKGRDGKRRTYRCSKRPGIDGCGGVSAYAEPIERIIETYAREVLAHPRAWQRIAELRAGSDTPALLAEINALEARLVELEQQLDEPGVPVPSILRAMDRARERLADCQQRLAKEAEAAVPAVYVGGEEWPDDLAGRRKLIALALGEERVYLDAVDKTKSRRFQAERVRIAAP